MIHVTNLRKSFGDNIAVNDLSFTIEPGEVFGLLGPNGAGKTTTVNLCVGLLTPDAGTAKLDGLGSASDAAVRAKIGVAPQTLSLYEELTARENLNFFGVMHGFRGRALKQRADWALEFANLTDRQRDLVKTFSGGMKRRLNLAAALVHDPPLLMLDEPTVGVDPQSRNAIFDRIEELKRAGKTIVYTTHYMEEAERLCDRVGIIDHGKFLALDTVRKLVTAHGGESTVVVETEDGEARVQTDDPLTELMKLRDRSDVVRFSVDGPNLESVFLKLTGRHLRD
jgi:ABC-2 type transport system ATP-binding protein